jgi:hypothetical protein
MTRLRAHDHAQRLFSLLGRHYRRAGYDWPACLRGCPVPIADYESEADLHTLKPDEPTLTLAAQRLINAAFARIIQRHGGQPRIVQIHTATYLRWLAETHQVNTSSARAAYLTTLIDP